MMLVAVKKADADELQKQQEEKPTAELGGDKDEKKKWKTTEEALSASCAASLTSPLHLWHLQCDI